MSDESRVMLERVTLERDKFDAWWSRQTNKHRSARLSALTAWMARAGLADKADLQTGGNRQISAN